ncbi:MAG: hypothetical protein V1793_24280 [Pseudomonadota bacterium]
MVAKFGRTGVAVLLAVMLLTAGYAFAGPDDLAKQADTIIRDAEHKLFSGNSSEADSLLTKAALLLDQGKVEAPDSKAIQRVERNFERVRKAVDKKLGSTGQSTSSKPSTQAPAMTVPPGDKLPGGVKKRLQDITRHLDNAERYVTSDARQAEYKLQQARELFDEIQKNYSGQFDPAHPDFASVQSRFNSLMDKAKAQSNSEASDKAAAEKGKAAGEEQSAEWIAKFRGFLAYPGQEGHNPDMLVSVPGTSEPEAFDNAQKRYTAFRAFFDEYKSAQFPNGRTWELQDLADNQAPLRLKTFEEEFASRIASVSGDAETAINAAMGQLEKDNGWRTDKTVKPNLVDQKWMKSIGETTRNAVAALGASDPRAKEIQAKFDALVAKDKENRQIRKERTFMTPDRYTGKDIGALKEKAEAIVRMDAKEGGEPLRCTIISENWQEETVKEWTDTTKTAWRIRTTRSVTAQAAARTPDGIRLITIALASDKNSDGDWGPLYGNLHQYSEFMLESNVNK